MGQRTVILEIVLLPGAAMTAWRTIRRRGAALLELGPDADFAGLRLWRIILVAMNALDDLAGFEVTLLELDDDLVALILRLRSGLTALPLRIGAAFTGLKADDDTVGRADVAGLNRNPSGLLTAWLQHDLGEVLLRIVTGDEAVMFGMFRRPPV